MNGMDMFVNTVLKACGYSKEQLDEGIATGKAKFAEFDGRFRAVETNIAEICANQREILALLRKGNDNASDAPSVDGVAG